MQDVARFAEKHTFSHSKRKLFRRIVEMGSGEKDVFAQRLLMILLPQQFQVFIAKRREKALYLFFGGISFLISVGCYAVFLHVFFLDDLAANLLSWILTTAFVFVTNRRWVFHGERKRGAELGQQLLAFYAGRVATLLVEEAIIALFAVYLAFPGVPVKVFAQVIVIVLNYIISKKLVFKRNR